MNERQKKRRRGRRTAHASQPKRGELPARTMKRESYPTVEKGHVVPKTLQRPWAVDGRVKVHLVGSSEACRFRPLDKVAVRDAPYRRVRPSGEKFDDTEASLNVVESKATEPLRALNDGGDLTPVRKHALAELLGLQLVRSPVFQEQRGEIADFLRQVAAEDMKPELLEKVGGDVEAAREYLADGYLSSTESMMAMLQYGSKLGGVLGCMRWQLVHFAKPRLVYSDHPVVLWPLDRPETQPCDRQRLGPHRTFEIRVPLGPQVGLLMNWIDEHDDAGMEGTPPVAAEFNAFTVAQAELEWMHRPGPEPTIPWRSFTPLSRMIMPSYSRDYVERSRRFAEAQKFAARWAGRKFADEIPIV